MTQSETPAARRSLFARRDRSAPSGPRATVRQLVPYLLEHKGVIAFVIVLSLLLAAASLAQPLVVGQVISLVEDGQPLDGLIWLLVVLVVAQGVISGYQHYLLQRTGEGIVLTSRKRLIARILNLPIAEFDTRRTGDLVSRVGSDTTLLRAVLTQGGVEAIGGIVTFVGALIAMLILDPVLLGLTVLVVAIALGTATVLSMRIREASHKAQEKVGALASSVERAISSVRTIRAAGATKREIEATNAEAEGAWSLGVRVAKISALVVPVAGIAMQVSFLVVLGVGGYRVADGSTSIANLVAFILFLFLMIMPLGQILGALMAINQALGALGRIQEVLDLPDEQQHDRELAPLAVIVGPANEGLLPDAPALEFDDVSFAYAKTTPNDPADPANESADEHLPEPDVTDRQPVLRGVSFEVPRGERVALVGPSGAGKSTILALIERFYDPSVGEVRLGGLDLRTIDRDDLRAQIGYVEQDAPVLAGTIRDNLKLGSPDASDEECEHVLRAVNLDRVLDRDPAGLDAQVGEDGIMLSGGERQRLAIARALLAAPPILLLDESTSSLDGVNERLMREAIDAVSAGRTLIVIAHRLSTVVDSDRIIVLDDGRVIGEGTHRELVENVPLYRSLAEHQLLV
ncbi:ABC transporter ATP-binding protein [Agromyces aerolatus]|uniref:ABC transporter ATP-binding protein n=1 Tax=Agromyces sp. LY-1074 TaxID=3074080 RepID=UPI00286332A1|nr:MULTISPECIES: ABC transporter ATP-binding protein [unclassified Agromyces]MDR5700300.1 ABC transporter ATP-binding protein [Agromyces sp. LY-1074]MDR5706722.1 ABC transporter ATP-binding protein [Agromyces sp. LY-1358]